MIIGRPHLHFRHTGSTNDRAREAAAEGAPGGTLVTAEEQTTGRGRQGRPWSTPPGSAVAWSVLIREKVEVPGTLPLQVGVGVCEAVESLGAGGVQMKWPNDIWIEGRKCAGILVEARPRDGWAVAGRFAAEILPGIFRLDDPCVQLRLAPEVDLRHHSSYSVATSRRC